MTLFDVIKQRRSVRSFNGQGITPVEFENLQRAIDESNSPFGGNVTIRLKTFDLSEQYRPSTYGAIRGASVFLLLAFADDEDSVLSAGFRMEQVVLRASEMGLGTCWIAATFRGSDFEKGEQWPDGEKLKVVSPVGVAADKSLRETVTRFLFRSQNRKSFKSLFFNNDFSTGLTPDSYFGEPLEMMRFAPSSINSQPWRALVVNDKVIHFYYQPKSNLSLLDCAIGMCHFNETEIYNGFRGKFFKEDNAPLSPQGWKYLRSYRRI